MSASWYDVLGVEPTASVDEIRTAWRAATDDLEPTDRRFDLYNSAAKVLLDADARAAYDAELGLDRSTPTAEIEAPEAAVEATGGGATEPEWSRYGEADAHDERTAAALGAPNEESGSEVPTAGDLETAALAVPTTRRAGGLAALVAPVWLLVAMTLAALVIALGTWWVAFGGDGGTEEAADEARAAAEANFGSVLTYRWDDLETAYQRATAVLTADYRAEFDAVWDLVENQAANVKAVVRTDVIDSGVVRTSDDGKRVELAVVIRNSVSNAAGDQGTGYLMLGVTMVDQDGTWLIADVDGLGTGDDGAAESPGEQPSSSPAAPDETSGGADDGSDDGGVDPSAAPESQ